MIYTFRLQRSQQRRPKVKAELFMKQSIYDKLEDIPEADRKDYALHPTTKTDSPYFGKYVLQLDGRHPVQVKNTELLAAKSTQDSTHQTAIQAKDIEITSLSQQLTAAKTQQGLPVGQIAVSTEDAQLLQNVKTLGKFEDIKAKVEEHATLKANEETQKNRDFLTEVAKAHGLNPEAFVSLAEQHKLRENIESRLIDDGKGKGEKVTHYFVKGKNEKQEDTSTLVSEFVKTDGNFKPFLPSLLAKSENGNTNTKRIPSQGVGDPVTEKSAASLYINQTYKRSEEKK